MKCSICKQKVEETFLKKPLGTYVKNEKGKKFLVCSKCQKCLKTKQDILSNLN